MNLSKKIISFIFYSLLGYQFGFAAEQVQPQQTSKPDTIYQKFAHDYLSKFTFAEKKEDKSLENVNIYQPIQLEFKLDTALTDGDMRKAMLELFTDLERKQPGKYQDILSSNFLRDIELFTGELFSKINRTVTVPGEIELAKMLCTPTTNLKVLQTRQAIIEHLASNDELFNQINSELERFAQNQEMFLSFCKSQSAMTNLATKALYAQSESANKSPARLTFNYFLVNSFIAALTIGGLIGTPISIYLLKQAFDKKNVTESEMTALLNGTALSIVAIITGIVGIKGIYNETNQVKILQNRMIHIAECKRAMQNILIKLENSKIAPKVSCLKHIKDLIVNSEKISDDMKLLMELLNKKTFKSKDELSLVHRYGNTLVAHKLMNEIKHEMTSAIKAFGQIDAYMSIAKLYREFKNKRVKYSFVNYLSDSTPYIGLKNFWHPVINTDTVVTNNIELGREGAHKGAIITGPNAGGKSTVLKCVLNNILFAYTLGIAPAEAASISVFDKVVSYMNITDDIAAKNSLFKAEAIRAFELAKTLQSGVKTFVVSDEMLTGTNPVEGAAAAYSIIKNFAQYNNALIMLATHFPLLTKLEKVTNGFYKNYKVSVDCIKENEIKYPYKLQSGVTNQNVAIDILKLEGFDISILDEAKQIIEDCKQNNTNIFVIQ